MAQLVLVAGIDLPVRAGWATSPPVGPSLPPGTPASPLCPPCGQRRRVTLTSRREDPGAAVDGARSFSPRSADGAARLLDQLRPARRGALAPVAVEGVAGS